MTYQNCKRRLPAKILSIMLSVMLVLSLMPADMAFADYVNGETDFELNFGYDGVYGDPVVDGVIVGDEIEALDAFADVAPFSIIEISTAEQLAAFLMGSGPDNGHFVLTDDIVATHGGQGRPRTFTGTFDGDGHTITGLTLAGPGTSPGVILANTQSVGFFQELGLGAVVKNLTLVNPHFSSDGTATAALSRFGFIAGGVSAGAPDTPATIRNVTIVNGTTSVVGTPGTAATQRTRLANTRVGGLVGTVLLGGHLVIEDASINVNLNGGQWVGGAVGNTLGGQSTTTIRRTEVTQVTAVVGINSNMREARVGGLIGRSQGQVAIYDSVNHANVRHSLDGLAHIGGLIGGSDHGVRIVNSTNRGNLIRAGSLGVTTVRVGGIIGDANRPAAAATIPVYLRNVTNYGNVDNAVMHAGGIIGQMRGTVGALTINGAVNHGEILLHNAGTPIGGGIVGSLNAPGSRITYAENHGRIWSLRGAAAMGGLIGVNRAASTTIERSGNFGRIQNATTATTASPGAFGVGGLIGGHEVAGNGLHMRYVFNAGHVSTHRSWRTGGLIGRMRGNGTIENFYSIGRVTGGVGLTTARTVGARGSGVIGIRTGGTMQIRNGYVATSVSGVKVGRSNTGRMDRLRDVVAVAGLQFSNVYVLNTVGPPGAANNVNVRRLQHDRPGIVLVGSDLMATGLLPGIAHGQGQWRAGLVCRNTGEIVEGQSTLPYFAWQTGFRGAPTGEPGEGMHLQFFYELMPRAPLNGSLFEPMPGGSSTTIDFSGVVYTGATRHFDPLWAPVRTETAGREIINTPLGIIPNVTTNDISMAPPNTGRLTFGLLSPRGVVGFGVAPDADLFFVQAVDADCPANSVVGHARFIHDTGAEGLLNEMGILILRRGTVMPGQWVEVTTALGYAVPVRVNITPQDIENGRMYIPLNRIPIDREIRVFVRDGSFELNEGVEANQPNLFAASVRTAAASGGAGNAPQARSTIFEHMGVHPASLNPNVRFSYVRSDTAPQPPNARHAIGADTVDGIRAVIPAGSVTVGDPMSVGSAGFAWEDFAFAVGQLDEITTGTLPLYMTIYLEDISLPNNLPVEIVRATEYEDEEGNPIFAIIPGATLVAERAETGIPPINADPDTGNPIVTGNNPFAMTGATLNSILHADADGFIARTVLAYEYFEEADPDVPGSRTFIRIVLEPAIDFDVLVVERLIDGEGNPFYRPIGHSTLTLNDVPLPGNNGLFLGVQAAVDNVLVAAAYGFISSSHTVSAGDAESFYPENPITIVLQRYEAPINGIRGFVREAEFPVRVIPGADVMLLDAAGVEVSRTVANEQGFFEFVDLAAGTYRIIAVADYFLPNVAAMDPIVLTATAGIITDVYLYPICDDDLRYLLIIDVVNPQGNRLTEAQVTFNGDVVERGARTWDHRLAAPTDGVAHAFLQTHGIGAANVAAAEFHPEFRFNFATITLHPIILEDGRGGIHGVVTRADNGFAIENANVMVMDNTGAEVAHRVTDEFGRYSVLNLAPGEYTVVVVAAGFVSQYRVVVVAADAMTVANFALVERYPAEDYNYVVIATITGAAANAEVTVETANATFTRIGTTNVFEAHTENALPSTQDVTARAPGHMSASAPVGVYTDNVARVTLALRPFELDPGHGGIYGRVTAAYDGAPIEDATILIHDANGRFVTSTVTDEHGNYVVLNLYPVGQFTVTAVAPYFVTRSYAVNVVADQMTERNFVLEAGHPGLSYIVIATVTGTDNLGAVTVTTNDATFARIADTNMWEARTAVQLPSAQEVEARAQGYSPGRGPVGPYTNGVALVNLALGEFDIPPGHGGIFGTVTASATGYPIADATIFVHDADGNLVRTTRTDADGFYYTFVLPGTYRVTAVAPNFNVGVALSVVVELYEMTEQNFVLSLGPEGFPYVVIATVTGAQDLAAVLVEAEGAGFSRIDNTNMWQARTATPLPSDRVVSASAPNHIGDQAPVGLYVYGVASVELELEFVDMLPGYGGIFGNVRAPQLVDGITQPLPLPNATIFVHNVATGELVATTVTDAYGNYRVINIAPGDYTVTVIAPNFLSQSATATVVAQQLVERNFLLVAGPAGFPNVLVATVSGVEQNEPVTVATANAGFSLVPGTANVWEARTAAPLPSTQDVTADAPRHIGDRAPVGYYVHGVASVELELEFIGDLLPGYGGIFGTVDRSDMQTVGGILQEVITPVPGATILVHNTATGELVRSATTDANGNYRILNIAPGVYRVTLIASGFEIQYQTVTVVADRMVEASFRLDGSTYNPAIRYTLATTVAPATAAATATVEMVPAVTFTRLTGLNTWLARGGAPMTGEVTATSPPDYDPASATVTAAMYVNHFANVTLTLDPNEIPPGRSGVRGVVTAAVGGAPIANASITVVDASGAQFRTTTNAQGEYSIINIAPGNFTITAVAPLFLSQSRTGDAPVDNWAIENFQLAADPLGATHILEVSILPLTAANAPATVMMAGVEFNRIGTGNVWEARGTAPMTGTVVGSAPNYSPQSAVVEAEHYINGIASVAMTLTRIIITDPTRGMIDGFVTLADHTPIQGATVTIIAADGTTVVASTNNIGYYLSTYLVPGTYTVIATAPNHDVVTRTGVVVTANNVTRENFILTYIGPGNEYTLFVTVAPDAAANVPATVTMAGVSFERQTGTNTWMARGAAPMTGEVTATAPPNFLPASATINANHYVNGVANVTLTLLLDEIPPGRSGVMGTVTAVANGAPIANATVIVVDSEGVERRTTTDAQGQYRIIDIAPNNFTITVVAPLFLSQSRTGTAPENAWATENFQLVGDDATHILAVSILPLTAANAPASVVMAGVEFNRIGTGNVWEARGTAPMVGTVVGSAPNYSPVSRAVAVGDYVDGVAYVPMTLTRIIITDPTRGAIDGFVRLANNAPVVGATVTIIAEDGTGRTIEASTNNIGYYLSAYLEPGYYTVIATAPNHSIVTRTGVEVVANNVTRVDFVLEYIGPGNEYTLFATIAPSTAANAATLTLTMDGVTFTREAGTNTWVARSDAMMLGQLTAAAPPTYNPASVIVNQNHYNVNRVANVLLTLTTDYLLRSGIRGTVTAAADGTPIANATIIVVDSENVEHRATTEANGAYQIINIAPGAYTITATAPDFYSIVRTGSVVPLEWATENFALVAGHPGLPYILVATVTGAPADAVSVTMAGITFNRQGTSNVWEARGAAPMVGTVVASAPNYGPQTANVAATDYVNGVASVALHLTRIIITDPTRGMIDGFVTLADHTPIANATVTIIAADGTTVTAVTNEIGYYRSTYLAPGEYTLIVTAPQHTIVTRTGVVVEANSVTRENFVLEAAPNNAYTLLVTLTPAEAANANASVTMAGQTFTRVENTNTWVARSATQMLSTVTASATGWRTATREIIPADYVHGVANVTINLGGLPDLLPGHGGIYGVVTGPTGAFVPNATVIITRGADNVHVRTVTTDDAGLYYAQNLVPGADYTVTVFAPLHGLQSRSNIVVVADQWTREDFSLTASDYNYVLITTVTGAPAAAVAVITGGQTLTRIPDTNMWHLGTVAALNAAQLVHASAGATHHPNNAPVGNYVNGVARVSIALEPVIPIGGQNQVTFFRNDGHVPQLVHYVALVDVGRTVDAPVNPDRLGFTFRGWYTDPVTQTDATRWNFGTVVIAPTSLYARWDVGGPEVTHIARFFRNDGTPNLHHIEFVPAVPGAQLHAPVDPTRVGFTFAYWSLMPLDFIRPLAELIFPMPITGDMRFYARWEAGQDVGHSVIFRMNDGTYDIHHSEIVSHGRTVTPPVNPNRVAQGYTFLGWEVEVPQAANAWAGTGRFNFGTPIIGHLVLNAVWRFDDGDAVPTHTVLFWRNDGSTPPLLHYAAFVPANEQLTAFPAAPNRVGFDFVNWVNQAGGAVVTLPFTVTGLTNLDADWTPGEGQGHRVAFLNNFDGADIYHAVLFVDHGSTVTPPAINPVREGYTFTGWYTEPAATNRFNFGTEIFAPRNLYAGWCDLYGQRPTFNIHFWRNDGTHWNEGRGNLHYVAFVPEGESLYAPTPNPVLPGFEFAYWSFDQLDFIRLMGVQWPITPTSNEDFFARWRLPHDQDQHTVVFRWNTDAEDYRIWATRIVDHNTTVMPPANPSRIAEGYTFLGWEVEENQLPWAGTGAFDFGTLIIGDLVLNAMWCNVGPPRPTHTLLFFRNDGTANLHSALFVPHGDAFVRPSDPLRSGWVFVHWSLSATANSPAFEFPTTVTAPFEVHAQWRLPVFDGDITIDMDEDGNLTVTTPPGTDYTVERDNDGGAVITITPPPGVDESDVAVNLPPGWNFDKETDNDGNIVVTITPPPGFIPPDDNYDIDINVDDDGNLTVTTPPGKDYTVENEDDGTIIITFPPETNENDVTVTVPDDWYDDSVRDDDDNLIIILIPPMELNPGMSGIRGTVTNAANEARLANATIIVTDIDGVTREATTNVFGHYQIANIMPGAYTITAMRAGFYTVSRTGSVVAGAVATENFALEPRADGARYLLVATVTGAPADAVTVTLPGGITLDRIPGTNMWEYHSVDPLPSETVVTAIAPNFIPATGTVGAYNEHNVATVNLHLVPVGIQPGYGGIRGFVVYNPTTGAMEIVTEPITYEVEIETEYEVEVPYEYEVEVPYEREVEVEYEYEVEVEYEYEVEVLYEYEVEVAYEFEDADGNIVTGTRTEMRTGTTTEIRTGIRTEINTGTRTEIEYGVRTEIQEGVRTETRTETTTEVRTVEIEELSGAAVVTLPPTLEGLTPVVGATVTILAVPIHGVAQYSRVVTTDANGFFSAPNVPVRDYIVAVSADGFKTTIDSEQPRPHTVIADQWTDVDFILEHDPDGDYAYLLLVGVTRGPSDRSLIRVDLQNAGRLASDDNYVSWTYSSDDNLIERWVEASAANFVTTRGNTPITENHYVSDRVAFVVLDLAPTPVGPRPPIGGNGGGQVIVTPDPPPLAPFIEDHVWYVRGFEDGTFRPANSITRAEVSMILWRLLDSEAKHTHRPGRFDDVSSGSWYAQAVNYLASRNILRGYEDGTFRPNNPITRAELTAVMSRFWEITHGHVNRFIDLDSSHWAYTYILNAHNKGWVTGYENGTFRPDGATNRAEAVTIINRATDRIPNPATISYHLGDLVLFTDLNRAHWAFYHIMEAAVEHEYERDAQGREIWTSWSIPWR